MSVQSAVKGKVFPPLNSINSHRKFLRVSGDLTKIATKLIAQKKYPECVREYASALRAKRLGKIFSSLQNKELVAYNTKLLNI